ncbi:hypothetical protein CQ12_40670 [Bradyrhizobium jicamae]|uniref:Uncharacterized protein n=1 Tax=Bradyrhizobium jicamae TaxID=280332 RepID=A0A0R3LRJ1_9BRAD|nr:hypothetical protein CQ12_40670 [Bradyrhizobium jicamae]
MYRELRVKEGMAEAPSAQLRGSGDRHALTQSRELSNATRSAEVLKGHKARDKTSSGQAF